MTAISHISRAFTGFCLNPIGGTGISLPHQHTGGVVEWSIAPVLKTGEPKGSVGSNPTPSAIAREMNVSSRGFALLGITTRNQSPAIE